jgi:ATP-dependent helicase/DNAse subunit B
LRLVTNRPGFYRALGEFISELKAAGISPLRFGRVVREREAHLGSRPALARKDREVALIYAAFQSRLEEGAWVQKEDLIAEAASLLKQNPRLLADEYRQILVDGFWEFPSVEMDLLEAVCAAGVSLRIALPWEEGRQVFAHTGRTLARLAAEGQLQRLETCALAARQGSPRDSLAYLERHLFAPPSDPRDELGAREDRPDIEGGAIALIEAPGAEGEVEMVAREIRGMIAAGNGVKPEQVLVVARQLEPYSRHLQRCFREYGIPFSLPAWVPLREIPLSRALECLLQVICEGWERRHVLALLKSGYLPIEPEKANWVEMEAQRRGIFRGRDEWFRDFAPDDSLRASETADAVTDFSLLRPEATEANRQKERALALVRAVEEALGRRPTPATFRAALLSWMKDQEVQKMVAAADAEVLRLDGLALLQIDELLREMEQAAGAEAKGVALTDLAERLREAMAAATVEAAAEAAGVTCLRAEDAGWFAGEVVFVLGLNEKEFPVPPREEPFYADWEREGSRHLGSLHLRTSREEAERERLLFYSAVTRATGKLYLCRQYSDSEGREYLESRFLSHVKRLFSPESVRRCTQRRSMSEVVPVEPLSDGEALNLAVVRALEQGAAGAGLAKERGVGSKQSVGLDARLVEVMRVADRRPEVVLRPGEFQVLSSFSASSLETYASCPFRYFAEEILGLEPAEEEIGPKERGQLLHQVLSQLLREEEDWQAGRRQELVQRARDILEERVTASGYGRRAEKGYRLGLLREALLLLLDKFVDEELNLRSKLPEFLPAYFELSFGSKDALSQSAREDAEKRGTPPASNASFKAESLRIGDSIFIRGRIDRLDLELGGKNCLIYDYKSGTTKFHADEMRRGTCIQIPLYLVAAADVWGFHPQAGLIYSAEGASSGILLPEMDGKLGFRRAPKSRLVVSDLEMVRASITPVVEQLVNGISSGNFQPKPGESCRWCRFPTLCRQGRAAQ